MKKKKKNKKKSAQIVNPRPSRGRVAVYQPSLDSLAQQEITQKMLLQMVVAMKEEFAGTSPFLKDSRINYAQFRDQFIMQSDINGSSRNRYASNLNQFFHWHETEKSNMRVTREMLLEYKIYLMNVRQLQPSTVGSYLVSLRQYFSWLERVKLYEDCSKGIKNPRRIIINHAKDSLTIENLKNLFAALKRETLEEKRNFALINLLLRSGLRIGEARNADIQDLDFTLSKNNVHLWIKGKGRHAKDTHVYISAEALGSIDDYLYLRGKPDKSEPLFTSTSTRNFGERLTTFSISRIVKQALRSAGLDSKRLSAHSLRHTFGTLSIDAGVDLYSVQLAMRHEDPKTTQIYLGDIAARKRLEASAEKMFNSLLNKQGIK